MTPVPTPLEAGTLYLLCPAVRVLNYDVVFVVGRRMPSPLKDVHILTTPPPHLLSIGKRDYADGTHDLGMEFILDCYLGGANVITRILLRGRM